ncbi:MAG: prepilin-type N-terminal cleavage/methylation domain-containing protein [Candidatus Omnitrophota bacterium]
MASKYSPRIRGFSLLELIMALAILTAGIVVVLQALSFCAQATGLSCDIIAAVFIAEDKIQELEFQEAQEALRETFEKGDSGRFNWARSVILDQDLNLYKTDIKISWQRQGRLQVLEANTYLRK